MKNSRIRELLVYNPLTGVVQNAKTQRTLHPDHDGLVVVFCSEEKKNFKLKLDRVAYCLAFGIFPKEDQRVLHKNLNTEDNRCVNLSLVSRAVFLQVKEAYKNLTLSIKIHSHPTDQFCYVVHWVENNKEKQKVVHDLIEARKHALKLQLKYSKVLTKYCLFD